MRIRGRLLLAQGIVLISLLSTIALSFFSLSEYRRIHQTIESGVDLVADARRVHVLMKDMLVGVFTPRTYGLLKDVVHLEALPSIRRFWVEEADAFQREFHEFMAMPRLRAMVARDPHLLSQYQVADRLGEQAFSMIHSVQARLAELDERGILGTDDLYQQIQRSDDPAMTAVFNEIREASFFLSNSFESFLHHFAGSLRAQAAVLQTRLAVALFLVAAVMTALGILIPHLVAMRIVGNVRTVARALRDVSRGDFSVTLPVDSRDEFAVLSKDFNSFVQDLRSNVEALFHLQRRLQDISSHEPEVSAVLQVVTDTLVQRGVTDWAAVAVCDHRTDARILSITGEPTDSERARICGASTEHFHSAPFEVPGRLRARLVAGRSGDGDPFNDLQHTIVDGYAEFASLVVENHYSYAELLERRNAQFQALEGQIRPHFLYNVLNNIVGLNRMGDRDRIESSIFALKELLRASLDSKDFVSLDHEFRIAERYCELQALRFGDRLSYEVVRNPDVANVSLPSLIVQPLVENAIIHGIEPLDTQGRVEVRAEFSGDHIRIVVEDNGVGFIPGPIERSTHIGLSNVRERLNLAYTHAELTVESEPGRGTRCSISIAASEVRACVS